MLRKLLFIIAFSLSTHLFCPPTGYTTAAHYILDQLRIYPAACNILQQLQTVEAKKGLNGLLVDINTFFETTEAKKLFGKPEGLLFEKAITFTLTKGFFGATTTAQKGTIARMVRDLAGKDLSRNEFVGLLTTFDYPEPEKFDASYINPETYHAPAPRTPTPTKKRTSQTPMSGSSTDASTPEDYSRYDSVKHPRSKLPVREDPLPPRRTWTPSPSAQRRSSTPRRTHASPPQKVAEPKEHRAVTPPPPPAPATSESKKENFRRAPQTPPPARPAFRHTPPPPLPSYAQVKANPHLYPNLQNMRPPSPVPMRPLGSSPTSAGRTSTAHLDLEEDDSHEDASSFKPLYPLPTEEEILRALSEPAPTAHATPRPAPSQTAPSPRPHSPRAQRASSSEEPFDLPELLKHTKPTRNMLAHRTHLRPSRLKAPGERDPDHLDTKAKPRILHRKFKTQEEAEAYRKLHGIYAKYPQPFTYESSSSDEATPGYKARADDVMIPADDLPWYTKASQAEQARFRKLLKTGSLVSSGTESLPDEVGLPPSDEDGWF